MTDQTGKNPPAEFDKVLEHELQAIRLRRSDLFGDSLPDGENVTAEDPLEAKRRKIDAMESLGLAFSGGGIRSASFALGVIQGLAELKLLLHVDYLSTVSGGGYIGAWLHGLFQRHGKTKEEAEALQDDLRPPVSANGGYPAAERDPGAPAARAVGWLRQYGNYLAPQVSFFSADVWHIAAIWIRNTLLNQSLLLLLLAAVLLIPRALGPLFGTACHAWWARAAWLTACVAIFIATLVVIGRGMGRRSSGPERQGFTLAVAAGLYSWAYCLSAGLWKISAHFNNWKYFPAAVAAGWFLGFAISTLVAILKSGVGKASPLRTTFAPIAASLTSAGMAAVLTHRLDQVWPAESHGGQYWAMAVAPVLFVGIVGLHAIFAVGLMGRYFTDFVREWWSRLGAWMLILTSVPLALSLISLYGPLAVVLLYRNTVLAATASAGWIGATIAGLLRGASSRSNGKEGKPGLAERLLPLAPAVFVLGALLLVATGVDQVSWVAAASGIEKNRVAPGVWKSASLFTAEGVRAIENAAAAQGVRDGNEALIRAYLLRLDEQPGRFAALGIVLCAGLCAFFGRLFDINEFSMHGFYRNRLVRAYLGASNPRRNPFADINLDPEDDIPLTDLRRSTQPGESYLGPVPLVNAAINLANDRSGRQERMAASFVFSPYHCGYELPNRDGAGEAAYRFLASAQGEAGITLGRAITVSGAAASPNMGYHTSPPVAFLMTLFNVRLGWWFPNPRRGDLAKAGPSNQATLAALLDELFATADAESDYVYLSDGGHFENLAVYELLRRRCRFIVCCDAEEDPEFTFGGLGSLIRKARADFGIEIDIDTSAIAARDAEGRSQRHCAAGTIWYPEPGLRGTLLYIKSSVTGDEPRDLLQYQSANRAFPHQPTGDQFFSESQLESYRRLGYHVLLDTFRPVRRQDGRLPAAPSGHPDRPAIFYSLRQAWRAAPRYSPAEFTALTARLDSAMERLRTDPALEVLHTQFYPQLTHVHAGGGPWWPLPPDRFREGFFFCQSLIQLMEDVYTGLDLEKHLYHPDCAGWINLFRQWTGSDLFRITYAIAGANYGGRFQSFACRHLGLSECRVELTAKADIPAGDFNDFELSLMEEMRRALPPVQFQGIRLCVDALMPSGFVGSRTVVLTAGFTAVSEGADELRWIRVQNHLRQMGIGRKTLQQLRSYRFDPLPHSPTVWEADSDHHIRWVRAILD